MDELHRALPALVQEADARGDRLAAATLASGVANMAWLARDAPDEARRRADDAMALWRQDDFQVQHYLDLVAQVQIDLYVGDGRAAWARITRAWPKVRASFSLLVQNFRVTLLHLRARAALAAAAGPPIRGARSVLAPAAREMLLLSTARDTRRIAREEVCWAAPLAAGLRAGVAAARQKPRAALRELDQAAALFDEVQMTLHAAAARHQRGLLLGGPAGEQLREEAARRMTEQGVAAPERFSALLIPGVPPHQRTHGTSTPRC
jgi:hypothetical protein